MNENIKEITEQTEALMENKEAEVLDTNTQMGETSKYRNLYVIIEQIDGKIIPVGLEMLSEARRLIDDFNKKYLLKIRTHKRYIHTKK